MMQRDPFTEEELEHLREISSRITQSTLAEDDILNAATLVELFDYLEQLRSVHGEHPAITETEADYTEDDEESIRLYREAIRLAEGTNILTYSIRLSLAHRYVDFLEKPKEALPELVACKEELFQYGDDCDRSEWWKLMKDCKSKFGRELSR